uniref:Trichohyalin-plectin-homology domain-containing protein n=1 Tax=Chromera velia CCMP2878 TaxID=1169474 RepID=A0A0G4HML7_9ALVE|eukprot:Cvel_29349.t1-p1 / transcript=Cvel_29349.t1 / gene=Cvel_29349 / organism=Chromera_velia_CCMP2878 / gene_product=Coiled-coil domain-containing protein 173, putative / transcript_product=Coiled-coil domain-containing protein 173, putative / location=Cvel_scaffold3994:3565-10778(+) / protein_length=390 / sequence_SO=supercontig / SO=protein_coding / is_pseudo=false
MSGARIAIKGPGPSRVQIHADVPPAPNFSGSDFGSPTSSQPIDPMELQDRRKHDFEEAAYQAQLRRATIERARRLMTNNADRYKTFASNLMLADVLHERENQKKIKKQFDDLMASQDEKFMEMERTSYRRMLEREVFEKDEIVRKNRECAEFRAQQLEEVKDKRMQEIEKETQRANEYLQDMRKQEAKKLEKEEEAIRDYAQTKEKVQKMMKTRAQEIFDSQMATRQAMIDAQAKKLTELKENESAKTAKEELEYKVREERIMQEREEERRKTKEMIEKHRNEQKEEFQQSMKRMLAREVQDVEERRAEAKKVAAFQQQQAELQRWKKATEVQQRDLTMDRTLKKIDEEEKEFLQYCMENVKEIKEESRNPIPCIKAIRSYQKSLQHHLN